MNKNQKVLYEALVLIANNNMILEDALNVIEKMPKKEVKEVINRFENTVTEFNKRDMYRYAYNFRYYSDRLISDVMSKLNKEV